MPQDKKISKKQARQIVAKHAPGTDVVFGKPAHYNPQNRQITSPPELHTITHEAAHAGQHKRLGPLFPAVNAVAIGGPLATIGLQLTRIIRPSALKRMPTYLPTAIAAGSQIPRLVSEAHANHVAAKEGGDPAVGKARFKPHLISSGLFTGSTLMGDIFHKRNFSNHKAVKKYAMTVPLNSSFGGSNLLHSLSAPVAPGPVGGIGRVWSVAEGLPTSKIAKEVLSADGKVSLEIANKVGLGRRLFRPVERAAGAFGKVSKLTLKDMGKGARVFGTYFVLKQILDSIQHSPLARHVPDVKTDVELIPTYSKQIAPLLYSLNDSERGVAARIDYAVGGNLTGMATGALQALRDTLVGAKMNTKNAATRGVIAFWLGMVTAELLGRGIHQKQKPQMLQIPASYPQNVDMHVTPYALSHPHEYPEVYLLEWAGKALLSAGSKMVSGVKAVPKAIGLTKGSPFARNLARNKVWRGLNTAANVAFIGDMGLSLANTAKAHHQMDEWDQQQKMKPMSMSTDYAGPVGTALNIGFGALTAGTISHNLKRRRALNSWDPKSGNPPPAWNENYSHIPIYPAHVPTIRVGAARQHIQELAPYLEETYDKVFLKDLRNRAAAIEHTRAWPLPRQQRRGLKRSTKVAIGVGTGAAAVGTGGIMAKKDYALGVHLSNVHVPKKARHEIASWLATRRHDANAALGAGRITKIDRRRMLSGQMHTMKLAANEVGRNARLKSRRVVLQSLAESEKNRIAAENQLNSLRGVASQWPREDIGKVVKDAVKPSGWSRGAKIVAGTAAAVGGGSSIEVGRRLGRHEERQRIRKTVEMETI